MVTDTIRQLQATKKKIKGLIKTMAATKKSAGKPSKMKSTTKAKSAGGASRSRRKRTTITEAMRGSLKKMVKSGKTGAEISKELGISLPSVHNVKKSLGLVKSR